MKLHKNRKLTQGGVLAQFHVVALEALFGPPSIVSSFDNNVNLLVAVLTNIPAEYPTSAVAAHRVSTVHGASPHVSYPISKHLWPGTWVPEEWVVRGDSVWHATGVTSIHINAKHFSQKSTSGYQENK